MNYITAITTLKSKNCSLSLAVAAVLAMGSGSSVLAMGSGSSVPGEGNFTIE